MPLEVDVYVIRPTMSTGSVSNVDMSAQSRALYHALKYELVGMNWPEPVHLMAYVSWMAPNMVSRDHYEKEYQRSIH